MTCVPLSARLTACVDVCPAVCQVDGVCWRVSRCLPGWRCVLTCVPLSARLTACVDVCPAVCQVDGVCWRVSRVSARLTACVDVCPAACQVDGVCWRVSRVSARLTACVDVCPAACQVDGVCWRVSRCLPGWRRVLTCVPLSARLTACVDVCPAVCQVDGVDLLEVTHDKAVEVIRRATTTVRFVVQSLMQLDSVSNQLANAALLPLLAQVSPASETGTIQLLKN